MKKLILALLCLLSATTTFAQNGLNGTWFNKETDTQKKDDKEISFTSSTTFNFNGKAYTQSSTIEVDMSFSEKDDDGTPVNGHIHIKTKASTEGQMEQNGKMLILTPGKKPKVEVESEIEGVPGGALVKTMLTNELKKELKSMLKKTQTYKLISLNDTKMILVKNLSEKEIKDGAKAEEKTFIRKK